MAQKYVSPYAKTESTASFKHVTHRYLIQHFDGIENDLESAAAARFAVLLKRPEGWDWKDTDYFAKRGPNLISKLNAEVTADALLADIINGANCLSSSLFPYRDFHDILTTKLATLEMTALQRTLLEFTLKSMDESGIVAPKIIAIYKQKFGASSSPDNTEGVNNNAP